MYDQRAVYRAFNDPQVASIILPMKVQRVKASPQVTADVGRVALRYGPLIYCIEETDNPGGRVQTLALPRSATVEPLWRLDLFDGAMTLTADAKRLVPGEGDALYSTEPPAAEDAELTALPYYLWANREPGSMQVWIAEAG